MDRAALIGKTNVVGGSPAKSRLDVFLGFS